MQTWTYAAVFDHQGDDEIVVRFPAIPEALTSGQGLDDARAMAADVLTEAVLGYLAGGREVPSPAASASAGEELIALEPLTAGRAAVQRLMTENGLSKVALAARMGKDEKVVRRILDGSGGVSMENVVAALRALNAAPILAFA
jgi:antitoxin HicB